MNCPNCQTVNPDAAKFCMNCGNRLAVADAGERSEFKLDRYLPQELIAKLEAARSRNAMIGERRVITMLFCDVKGSTAAAEKVDPETWTEIMNGVFEYMIRPIYKYEGLVPRLMGDAILAFFGAPIAHEDDPQRAVLAGLEIQEGIKSYADEVRLKHGLAFGLRVGINTGWWWSARSARICGWSIPPSATRSTSPRAWNRPRKWGRFKFQMKHTNWLRRFLRPSRWAKWKSKENPRRSKPTACWG
ncbi:MAG: zinc-ribbon domain-containing protein [Chloroflexi bacterium]|nr:zinc-ribbon domain-containing protein [Chloroflexota bacterium]